ncbi:uncharacterized protein LOC119672956 [Teleopsis dalmanni]|uniref:uncharacterized protein LOC119672950 n=1 Tax=Teleopsis dalmanni TaxID=139649 RepID=UPI0018CE21AC|nr:uncharacterized protein LOC119672950 [Teleopsis dalmanni]XP_037940070.1 uncharacterized protein LOC119672956 [Teleopsis dalmanni]
MGSGELSTLLLFLYFILLIILLRIEFFYLGFANRQILFPSRRNRMRRQRDLVHQVENENILREQSIIANLAEITVNTDPPIVEAINREELVNTEDQLEESLNIANSIIQQVLIDCPI